MMTAKTSQTMESTNKALVLEAFDTLFNKRDYVAAGHFWSTDYIQHSAHIASGRDGLFDLIKSAPATLKYESGTAVAEGDFVIVRAILGSRLGCELGCGGHRSNEGWAPGGTLGCNRRRSHSSVVQKPPPYVRR